MNNKINLLLGSFALLSLFAGCANKNNTDSVPSQKVPAGLIRTNAANTGDAKRKPYTFQYGGVVSGYKTELAKIYDNLVCVFWGNTLDIYSILNLKKSEITINNASFTFSYVSSSNGVLQVTDTDTVYYFDAYANMIFSHDTGADYKIYSSSIIKEEKEDYQVISFINESTLEETVFEYSGKNGNYKKTIYNNIIPSLNYKDKISLESHGLKDYYMVYDYFKVGTSFANCTYFYKGNKLVSTFTEGSNGILFTGGHIIYQKRSPVPDDAEEFSFIDNYKNKYLLKTYQFDITTGKTSTINLDYIIIDNNKKIKDKYGNYTLYYSDVCLINKNKSISATKKYIIDQNGKLLYDASLTEFSDYYCLGNNFINLKNGTLYDNNMNLKDTYLLSTDVNVIAGQYLSRSISGINNYCLADKNMHIIIPETYDKIAYTGNDTFIAYDKYNASLNYYNLKKESENKKRSVYFYSDVSSIGNGLWYLKDVSNKKSIIIDNNNEEHELPYDENYNFKEITGGENNKNLIVISQGDYTIDVFLYKQA